MDPEHVNLRSHTLHGNQYTQTRHAKRHIMLHYTIQLQGYTPGTTTTSPKLLQPAVTTVAHSAGGEGKPPWLQHC